MPSASAVLTRTTLALHAAAPIGVPESVVHAFLDEVEQGRVTRDWYAGFAPRFAKLMANTSRLADQKPPAAPTPAQPVSAYAGIYANTYYGPAELITKGSGLALVIGPKRMELPLSHWDANTFSYFPPGENGNGITAIDFVMGADGRATTMTVENMNTGKLGVFKRE
jgi:hypothetical protein